MNKKLRKLACILGALAVINLTAFPAVKTQAATAVEEASANTEITKCDVQIKRISRNEYTVTARKKNVAIKDPKVEVRTCFYYNDNGKMSVAKMLQTAIVSKISNISVKAPAKIANRWSRVTIDVYVDGKLVKSINQTL